MTKNTKVTLNYDVALNSLTYAQLYLQNRIEHCKSNGHDYVEYEQELADINKAIAESSNSTKRV